MVDSLHAWHPDLAGVQEVLHATMDHHAYPLHTHDSWTVLLIDEGAVRYDLHRAGHHAAPGTVTLLPPFVPHDGRSAQPGPRFRKRVLYLDADWLPPRATRGAVDAPLLTTPHAVRAARAVHAALAQPADEPIAEHALLDLRDIAAAQFGEPPPPIAQDAPLARRLRRLLDDRLTETVTLADAAVVLGAHPGHLSRIFAAAYGIAPHRDGTGRRVDRARRLLLAGVSPSAAAAAAGFFDQPHLTRHFRAVLGTTPAAFAARGRS